MRRRGCALLIGLAIAVAAAPSVASSGTRRSRCVPRLLVLSAYPGEIDKIITTATVRDAVVVDGRSFYVGRLNGNDVVMALSGIGLVNAERTTRTAIDRFRCGTATAIKGIVFSGVAGGRSNIGDVTVPSRWTIDDGKTWFATDPTMFAVARAVIGSGGLRLTDQVPLGDLACVGIDPRLVNPITMPTPPQIMTGGDGKSADTFGGRAFPCVPGGGDVFGCEPCRAPTHQSPDVVRFVNDAAPFADPNFFLDNLRSPTPSSTDWVAEDMETAAVARVATQSGIPFIAFRAMSDGKGDPLMLPGFPFQFFVYRQLAADNAATVALAFLRAWARR